VVAEGRVPGHVEADRLEWLLGILEQAGKVADRHVLAQGLGEVLLGSRRVAVPVLLRSGGVGLVVAELATPAHPVVELAVRRQLTGALDAGVRVDLRLGAVGPVEYVDEPASLVVLLRVGVVAGEDREVGLLGGDR
jgi:hypothetical protein